MNLAVTSRIEICGTIASGKSTVAECLADGYLKVVKEDFHLNPFLRAFYESPAEYSFETEICFLLQHYHQLKIAHRQELPIACDFSFLLDLAFAEVTLDPVQRDVFRQTFEFVTRELPLPTLFVRLRCSPEELLQRIKTRGRSIEQSITSEYLGAVDEALDKVLEQRLGKARILQLRTDSADLIADGDAARQVAEQVRLALAEV